MTVKAESGKGSARAWGDEEAAQPMGSRKAAACAVPRDRGTGERRAEDPHGSARRSPACARNVRKTLHDKEVDADPVRRSPAARPSSGECCRSDDTRSSVLPFFTDGSDVAHSRLSDVPGEGAAGLPRCSWAGGQKSSYNARHAGVAQLVERRLPKPEVASSRLVARSTFHHRRHHRVGGHGVQAHGQHPKAHGRRHPGRFPVAAARAFQRQASSHLPLFFWQRLHEARHHVSPPSCAGCACPARKRRVPAQLVLFRAAPGPGAVTVSRAAPAGHAGWRHLPSARTTLR